MSAALSTRNTVCVATSLHCAGVRASAIHSLMPHDIVKAELSRFRAGELDVLFNVEVWGQGVLLPAWALASRPQTQPPNKCCSSSASRDEAQLAGSLSAVDDAVGDERRACMSRVSSGVLVLCKLMPLDSSSNSSGNPVA